MPPKGSRPAKGRPGAPKKRKPARPGAKGKTDTWLIAAIIAAVVAIILIIYGISVTGPEIEIDIQDIQPQTQSTDTLGMLSQNLKF